MGVSIPSKKVIRVLEEHGFIFKSSDGSHHKYVKGSRTAIVPHPKKHIPIGTLSSIADQAGLSLNDFKK